ncbi:MAG: R3H domain-containing nucleic acid-binding protein [Patescibacteria group bacterium]
MNNQEIENLIKELIEKTNIKIQKISVIPDTMNNTWFAVDVDEPHFFINNEGEALQALNHLVRRLVENKMFSNKTDALNDTRNSILIDINDFQKKKVESVRAIAHMMGERAKYFKANVEVDPMSSFDRRIVHEFLANREDLKTESVGLGPTRRVVIKYVGVI